ncbi:hypothetical protein FRAAL4017 [Frankia alni ACN14a]|uniref:Uncharacterized protein n=1 Tax=Frankia alni (strain DSM 45986 / CECT 9034 / ACN14a) TaxID=326424 RepID=Q0RIK9_FRAAA|nr:hypothetical protein FRAAL4017 [Frankia alni ACN14a]
MAPVGFRGTAPTLPAPAPAPNPDRGPGLAPGEQRFRGTGPPSAVRAAGIGSSIRGRGG